MTYGSHLNSSREVMVHWPTTGFLPNGRWSITLSTMGGVYISSFGRSWMQGVEEITDKYTVVLWIRCIFLTVSTAYSFHNTTFDLGYYYFHSSVSLNFFFFLPLWWRGQSWGSSGSFSCSWWRLTPPAAPHTPPPGWVKTRRPTGTASCSSGPMLESGYMHTRTQWIFRGIMCVSSERQCLKAVSYLHSSQLNHRPDALRNHVEVLCSLWGNQGKIQLRRLHRERRVYTRLIWGCSRQYFVFVKHQGTTREHSCVYLSEGAYSQLHSRAYLVFKDEFSSQQCLPRLQTFLYDGMPQQFGCLIHAWIQLHHWRADTAAQQLILTLGRRWHVTVIFLCL